jgi:hypothetical protein
MYHWHIQRLSTIPVDLLAQAGAAYLPYSTPCANRG